MIQIIVSAFVEKDKTGQLSKSCLLVACEKVKAKYGELVAQCPKLFRNL